MGGTFDHLVNARVDGQPATQLVQQNVDAIKGVSSGDAQKLKSAFGIETVGDLAGNAFVTAAQTINDAASELGHDPGPSIEWTRFFEKAPLTAYQAEPTEFRLDFGPVYYRGRLDGTARVIVLGQDPAANELVANRNFVGASGQRIQGFLNKLGVTRDYVMVNTFLYPVFGQVLGNRLETLSHTDPILSYRNELLDRLVDDNPAQVIIAVGGAARDALEHWPNAGTIRSQHITHPSARDNETLLANWNVGIAALRNIVGPEPGKPTDQPDYGTDFTAEDHLDIPRFDLPFGTPSWHGVGTHASRARKDDGRTDNKRITWKAP